MSIEAYTPNSDRLYRALIEHNPEVIALLSPEGTVLYTSPSIQRVLGYTPEECMAKSAGAIVHPDDRAALAHTFQHLLAIPGLMETHQFRCRHKDGTWRWVEAVMTNVLQDPDVQALVMYVRDISERNHAEEEHLMALVEKGWRKHIEESEQRFRLLADGAPVMIWTSGIDKLCAYFNAPG